MSQPTSTSDRRNRQFLLGVWVVMFVVGLVYVSRYARINPYVDEWAFTSVLFGEEPARPWLWGLHNEHRFVLPRIIYLALFRLTGDLRTGCFVSLIGISLIAGGLMRLARVTRGRASMADAVFPLMLMHTGQGENLYMGYQLAFMLTTGLAAALFAVIIKSWGQHSVTAPAERPAAKAEFCRHARGSFHFRQALQATVLGWLLLTCGAAGLAYGIAAAAWVLFLAVRVPMLKSQRAVLIASTAITLTYLVAYFHGYDRPAHHPPSAGIAESVRIGLEAQAMAFGPGVTGIWPVIGVAIVVVATIVVVQMIGLALVGDPRSVGLLLVVFAGAAVAFGIGWGRSGFRDDMGFAWRYGWIAAPPIFASYFTWILWGGRVSLYGPSVLALVIGLLSAIGTISGFIDGETVIRKHEREIEADVRSGMTADEVVARHFQNCAAGLQVEIATAMRRMRDHRYAYYEALGREEP